MTKLAVALSAKDHRQGDKDAPCTLVEYGDYQCPSCGQAYPIVKRLQKHFGKRMSFVFRNFPLTQIHRLDDDLLVELAQALHLAPAQLLQALETKEFQPRVRADFNGGVRSGVNGTPTFFINGQRHDGSYDFASLVEAIDLVLE
jgi:protein-disulfide isomerase